MVLKFFMSEKSCQRLPTERKAVSTPLVQKQSLGLKSRRSVYMGGERESCSLSYLSGS